MKKNQASGRFFRFLLFFILGFALLPGCGGAGEETDLPPITPGTPGTDEPGGITPAPPTTQASESDADVRLSADRDDVTAFQPDGTGQRLLAPGELFLGLGSRVDVSEAGRAILRFADLLTVEVLRDGELQIQELDIADQDAIVSVLLNGGALLNDFDPQEEIERRFTVQTEFATITATGTKFLVVREADTPLEWIVGLDSEAGDLMVTADGVTKEVLSNEARWVAPIDEPSAGISAEMGNVQEWITNLQVGQSVREIGETLWAQADVLINTGVLAGLPAVGERAALGDIGITLLPGGDYSFEDCNGDFIPDIAAINGEIELDFREVLNRVRAVDVTVYKVAGGGLLEGLDPAAAATSEKDIPAAADQLEVLSLRSETPFHYALLSLEDGCFIGVSLTPPEDDGADGMPRSPIEEGEGVIIDSPEDGATNVVNEFIVTGRTTLTPGESEGALSLFVETPDGEILGQWILTVGDWDPDQGFSTFSRPVYVETDLPAEIRIRVRYASLDNESVVAEDSVLLSPLNPYLGTDRRPPVNGRLRAARVGSGGYQAALTIDGTDEDWQALQKLRGGGSAGISHTVFDLQCSVEYPDGAGFADLVGSAMMAYDEQFLYVSFSVFDDGYDGYLGAGELYFNGDAPQILLDLDLPGDFADQKLSPDDIQLDFLPGRAEPGDMPLVAFWQLDSRESWVLEEAAIASRWTGLGYFLEAAIPWGSLGIAPEPGQSFGIAASISDNDTPGTDVQECMISTAPERDWQNPTTWGTLTLEP